MKRFKIIPIAFIITLLAFSLLNINLSLAGYKTDPTGETAFANCEITRLDIDQDELKITLNTDINVSNGESNWYTYNIWVDTSMDDFNPDTTTWSTNVFEYVAHLTVRNISNVWTYTSYLWAFRYYADDSGVKHNGEWYWNPNTDTWVASDPGLDVAVVSGNTISFNVTGAIYREAPEPCCLASIIQGVANAGADESIKDIAPNNGWVTEFDNLSVPPSSNTSTPSSPFPGFGFLVSFIAIGFIASSIYIVQRRRN